MTSYDELGKTVFDGFLEVRPQGASKLIVSYKLPFKLDQNSNLPLLVQKQPGTDKDHYVLTKGGAALEEFDLASDKTVNLKLR
jgi:hypothetical protein